MSLWQPCIDPAYVEGLRSFAAEHIAPEADAIDREDVYPTAIVKALAIAGYNAATTEPRYGGGGLGYGHAAAIFEEVSYASAAVGISLITIFQAQTILKLFGSDQLKDEFLPRFAQGLISSYALTEASHGSDIRSLDTKAVREGEGWTIRGRSPSSPPGRALSSSSSSPRPTPAFPPSPSPATRRASPPMSARTRRPSACAIGRT
ncbi:MULTISPECIES: acyl-CoA dehydrogenase family protein [unclassified Methylobacterium]|uniref:acyl-CoA dehydrogenase family protein n=1 Tax=unclassified Methylobacterium TaxID=2615210 RepID=UPI001920A1D8